MYSFLSIHKVWESKRTKKEIEKEEIRIEHLKNNILRILSTTTVDYWFLLNIKERKKYF